MSTCSILDDWVGAHIAHFVDDTVIMPPHRYNLNDTSTPLELADRPPIRPCRKKPERNRNRCHAIIIPFRDRHSNLDYFIAYMGLYLTRFFPRDSFSLYIVEQGDHEPFNRGFLFNVGFREAIRRIPSTRCVSIHDVDLIPQDLVPYTNCTFPIQLGAELEHFGWDTPYPTYAGGVLSMHAQDWVTINGMSNDFEGWGGEDDELYERLLQRGLLKGTGDGNQTILRPPKGYGRYKHIENKTTTTAKNLVKKKNPNYKRNVKLVRQAKRGRKRWKSDGLSDLRYVVRDCIQLLSEASQSFHEVHVVTVVHNSVVEQIA